MLNKCLTIKKEKMSNTFEFAERLGFESPFEFDDLTNGFNFIWTGVVDYNKLVDKFC